jgi:protein tyrosine/serine phosphatase
MIGVHPDYLGAAFDAITKRWGSLDRYFEAAAITDARRERLRASLVDPAGVQP